MIIREITGVTFTSVFAKFHRKTVRPFIHRKFEQNAIISPTNPFRMSARPTTNGVVRKTVHSAVSGWVWVCKSDWERSKSPILTLSPQVAHI